MARLKVVRGGIHDSFAVFADLLIAYSFTAALLFFEDRVRRHPANQAAVAGSLVRQLAKLQNCKPHFAV